MKIYAPVKDADGVWATVRFVNGVGETDNLHLIEWFRTHGYEIGGEPIQEVVTVEIEKPIEPIVIEHDDKPNFDSMNPLEIRDWAKAHGYGGIIKNTRNKEKLIELLRG